MTRGFLFHRNLSTTSNVLDYDYYFYSFELIDSMLDGAPLEYRKLLSDNLSIRNKVVKKVISELEIYLKKKIELISLQNYHYLKEKYQIDSMQMSIPSFEQSVFENLVDKLIVKKVNKEWNTQNFTKFYKSFRVEQMNEPFIPKTETEKLVAERLKNYPFREYNVRRTKISPLGTQISPYVACGVISLEQLFTIANKLPISEGSIEFHRQLCWIAYMKIKETPPENFPVLSETEKINYKNYVEGTLKGDLVEDFINQKIKVLKEGGLLSNRTRLMLSYYLMVQLGIYWQYGDLFFRSILTDFHPRINRHNWFAQSKNRFLKLYNLKRQIKIHGDN